MNTFKTLLDIWKSRLCLFEMGQKLLTAKTSATLQRFKRDRLALSAAIFFEVCPNCYTYVVRFHQNRKSLQSPKQISRGHTKIQTYTYRHTFFIVDHTSNVLFQFLSFILKTKKRRYKILAFKVRVLSFSSRSKGLMTREFQTQKIELLNYSFHFMRKE